MRKIDFYTSCERWGDKLTLTVCKYEKFMLLYKGQYFGDIALHKQDRKRVATVQAEEDCILGLIPLPAYEKYLFDEKKKLKVKEIAFLNDNYFFYLVKTNRFENRYYNHFACVNLPRSRLLFKENTPIDKSVFIKEEKIEINFHGSILELCSCIKRLIENYYSIKNKFSKIKIQIDDYLNKYMIIENETLENANLLKYNTPKYIEHVTAKRNIHLFILSNLEICGLEDFFLDNKCFTFRATVCSDKSKVYTVDKKVLKRMMED